jgi:putative transposase
MPRAARVVLPGYLYHVTQRGNNRQFVFHEKNDYVLYLKHVEKYRDKYDVKIYAFCIMGNHVHFIIRPKKIDSMAKMFRGVNMRYAQYYQKKMEVSGHVWQGRYFSCLLSGSHIKESIRYVELNPVRAKMVEKAWQYPWSSARAHLGKPYNWIQLEQIEDILKVENYKAYLQGKEDEDFLKRVREMTKKNLALGSSEFIVKLEGLLGRSVSPKMGRPKKTGK